MNRSKQQTNISIQDSNNTKFIFDVQKIHQSVLNGDDITIKQVHNSVKQLQYSFKQMLKDIMKIHKEIQHRPTISNLKQNLKLTMSSLHSDPNISKLLIKRQNFNSRFSDNSSSENSSQSLQLKSQSKQFGLKLNELNEVLPILLSLIKSLQKQSTSQFSSLNLLIEEKTQSLSDQLMAFKEEQLSQKLSITQKIQINNNDIAQRVRQLETKQSWQLKDIKNKIQEKVSKNQFILELEKTVNKINQYINKFQEESASLVNPQKIKQIEKQINDNKLELSKSLISCQMKISSISNQIQNELVNLDQHKKQKIVLQKRITNINTNFEEIHTKITKLNKGTEDYQKRLKFLQTEHSTKTKQIQDIKNVLKNLQVTEQFQKLLSKLDPEQMSKIEVKVQDLILDSLNCYKQIGNLRNQVDKLSQSEIQGVLIPNKPRNKELYLQDLKEIIDEYFAQNRYAYKINKLENDVNDQKVNVQAIKLLEKKFSRFQKQNELSYKLSEDYKIFQMQIRTELTIFEQKVSQLSLQNETNRFFMKGLTSKKNIQNIQGEENQNIKKRKSLITQTSARLQLATSQNKLRTSHSLRKVIALDSVSREMSQTFYKSTISSGRKNILKSNTLFNGQ